MALAALVLLLFAASPAFSQLQGPPTPGVKIQAADAAAGDLFGCALALDGNTAVVGSVLDDDGGSESGSLYVYALTNGTWNQRAKLLAPDPLSQDQLGYAVGLSGDRIAAGAPFREEAGQRAGAVYLFRRVQGAWLPDGKLLPPEVGPRDELGRAVAISGAIVAAGAPGDDDRGSSAGAVYVFEGSATPQKLTAADGAAGDGFGFSLALDGNRLMVGAPFSDDGGAQAGSVYLFERGAGGWHQVAKLTAADRRGSSLFGGALALSGSRAAIGARLDDGAGTNAGAVYVFGGGARVQEAKLLPPDLAAGDELGISVALDGDVLIAGARYATVDGVARAGAAYRFKRIGGSWQATHRLASPSPGPSDELGFAVGLADSQVFAGAYRDDDGGGDAGTVCAFEVGSGTGDPQADLGISKSDGRGQIDRGESTVYTIVVSNAGPADVSGARVVDDFVGALSCSWECSSTGGASCGGGTDGSGDIDALVDLPRGGTVTYEADCSLRQSFGGSELVNRATVSVPQGVTDPNPSNDTAVDVNQVGGTPMPPADLGITKTDGVTMLELVPEVTTSTTYVIAVTNAGPAAVTGARVLDRFDDGLTCSWTCAATGGASCGDVAAGTGDIDTLVDLPVRGIGGSPAVTYSAFCVLSPSFTEDMLVNTATVSPPTGVSDPDASNNSATDLNEIVRPQEPVPADLLITKTKPGAAEVTAGDTVSYVVTAGNLGPTSPVSARVEDVFSDGLSGCSWTCTGTGAATCGSTTGTGDISDDISLPVGRFVRYNVTCLLDPAFPEDVLVNTATVTIGEGFEDPVGSNDTAALENLVRRESDLFVTKTAEPDVAVLGETVTFLVTVGGTGPSTATGALVTDSFPEEFDCSWECSATDGSSCGADSGMGDIEELVTIAPSGAVTFAATCTVTAQTSGTVTNTATVTPPPGLEDPNPDNDTDSVPVEVTTNANVNVSLTLTKTADAPTALAGDPVSYSLTLSNAGPEDALGVRILDPLPANLQSASWSCGSVAGTGSLDAEVDVPAGGSVACSVTGASPPSFCGPLVNTATYQLPPGVVSSGGSPPSSTAEVLVSPQPGGPGQTALCASKAVVSGPHAPGSTVVYEVLLFNGGPAPLPDLPGPEFTDDLPPELSNVNAVADSGSITLGPGNLVSWNGPVPAGGLVVITIEALIQMAPVPFTFENQGTFGGVPTDDPETPDPDDPTVVTVSGIVEIPTLGSGALALLALLLGALALSRLRRRRVR